MEILQNAVQCKYCHDIIVSQTIHDFRCCSCGKVAVDGGHAYLKRTAATSNDYIECSLDNKIEFTEDFYPKVVWGTRGPTGLDDLKWVFIKDLEINHLKNILINCMHIANYIRDTINFYIIKKEFPIDEHEVFSNVKFTKFDYLRANILHTLNDFGYINRDKKDQKMINCLDKIINNIKKDFKIKFKKNNQYDCK